MKVLVPMRDALADDRLLGRALNRASWDSWKILLVACAGEPLLPAERRTFKRLTGRDREPGRMCELMLCVAGRRSGKSKAAAVFMVWLATCCDWTDCLSLGERGVCLVVAPTERQAAVTEAYIRAIIDKAPLLASLVEERLAHVLTLRRGTQIEVLAANARWVRGITCIGICLDESAYLPSGEDAINSDISLLEALRPAVATTSAPLLLTSSPATTTGIVHSLWKKHFGATGDPLAVVVQSDSLGLNPTLKRSVVDKAFEEDAASAQREYGGEFAEPMTAFLTREIVMRCVEAGVTERAPLPGVSYASFIDASSGSGSDSFACAIGHRTRDGDRDVVILDCLIAEKPPFDPLALIAALCGHLQRWGIRQVAGDSYSGNFLVSALARHGVSYMASKLSASELYSAALPAFTSGTVVLLDNPLLIEQLVALRRRIGQAGKEFVQHMRNQHDDLSNSACGLIHLLTPLEQTASTWAIPGVVREPRIYPTYADGESETWQAWRRTQTQHPFYAPKEGERSIHHGVPDPRVNALW
jgi:hypothetical protein